MWDTRGVLKKKNVSGGWGKPGVLLGFGGINLEWNEIMIKLGVDQVVWQVLEMHQAEVGLELVSVVRTQPRNKKASVAKQKGKQSSVQLWSSCLWCGIFVGYYWLFKGFC